MYNPSTAGGGRSWLMALILGTKPFYHAALSIGAYYHLTVVLAQSTLSSRLAAKVQQERRLQLCIRSLNESAQNSCKFMGLGILTSVIQLVFYEVSLPLIVAMMRSVADRPE